MNPLKAGDIVVSGPGSLKVREIIARHFVASLNRSKEWRCLSAEEFLRMCREKKTKDATP